MIEMCFCTPACVAGAGCNIRLESMINKIIPILLMVDFSGQGTAHEGAQPQHHGEPCTTTGAPKKEYVATAVGCDGAPKKEYIATAVGCDDATKMCNALFDKEFTGQCIMYIPPFPSVKEIGDFSIGYVRCIVIVCAPCTPPLHTHAAHTHPTNTQPTHTPLGLS